MATHVYTLLKHQLQRQDLVDLQQRLSNYSIASRVIPLPVPKYFYPESIDSGLLVLPEDWLRLELDHELDVKMRTQNELTELSIINGSGLEIYLYKYLMVVQRHAGEKWTDFILDPIRRLSLKQDIQALADFLGIEQVVYLPGGWLPELESCTFTQLISYLHNHQHSFIAIKETPKQISSYRELYEGTKHRFCCVDRFEHSVTAVQLQSLANLQLALLVLGLDPDDVDYFKNKLLNRNHLIEQLEIKVVSYSQSVMNVTQYIFDELTQEQRSLINLLSEELKKYLSCQHFDLLNYWKEMPLQELIEETLKAFAWDSLDLNDWFEEQLEKTKGNT